jgi:predicted amidophosphoribosyltransferase
MTGQIGRSAPLVMLRSLALSVADTIYPPRCIACPEPTEAPHGLCPSCWRETHFIAGGACACCGVPLVGAGGADDLCDRCLRHPPPWRRGAAAVVYGGAARRAVLAFKHGDRLDLADPLAGWMAAAGRDLLEGCDLITPVPLHWRRLLARRYNQASELAKRLGRRAGRPVVPDLLHRTRRTVPQERMDHAARAANQAGAIAVTSRRRALIAGRAVLLVDDVMTSGATLSASAECLLAAGAGRVDVLVLARVAFADSLAL